MAPRRDGGGGKGRESESLRLILARIEAAKYYPVRARKMGIEGTAVVRFRLRPDGGVEEVEIVRTSGHRVLDLASMRAITRAAPLPYAKGWLRVAVSFKLLRD